MRTILPSFGDLLAFDAAARHGSFTRAARDLNVSQPAISRRVAALEADLGVTLFGRETKPLQLTPTGRMLFDVLRSGLSRLEATIAEIRRTPEARKLTIAAAPGFLTFWLLPRLSRLSASFPGQELQLITGDQPQDLPEADIHVRFGDGNWPGTTAVKIMGKRCSRSVARCSCPGLIRSRISSGCRGCACSSFPTASTATTTGSTGLPRSGRRCRAS